MAQAFRSTRELTEQGLRPIHDILELSTEADRVWTTMEEADWLEAFACQPRIGERKATQASAQSTVWSRQEQSSVSEAQARVLAELAEGNALYEQRFGFTYIVCATDKTADEMLDILNGRLASTREAERRLLATSKTS
jgi:2-oxo-4-hydroxy-4-carboxy-5-ureidoimidazoline decarboxylase